MIYGILLVGAIIVAFVYRLQMGFMVITILIMGSALPFFAKARKQQIYHAARLTEVSTYIETMLYAFKRKPKVLDALKDTQVLFVEGEMGLCVEKAVHFLEEEYYDGNREEKALGFIEEQFPNDLIRQMHQYFLKVESIGGEYGMAIEALITEKNMWVDRSMEYKKECEKWRRNINIGIIISLVICIGILYLLPQEIEIRNTLIYQVGTVISFIGYTLIFLKTQNTLAIDYVTSKSVKEEYILTCYKRIEEYSEQRERKKSFCYAIFPLLGMGGCLIFLNAIGSVVFLLLTMVTMCQHKIGLNLNKKSVELAIVQAFPQWLLEIALLMQTENVQTAIAKSRDRAPRILQPEIDKLIQELIAEPEGIDPYIHFLKSYQNMEILSAMKILYSISTNSTGNVQKQIEEVLNRSNRLRNYVEIQKNETSLAGMNILFLLPVLVAGGKMLIDMTLFLIVFLQQASI